jgi:hypothetical protein
MITIGVAVFAFGIAVVWFLLVRGSKVAAITEDDFHDTYDELVAEGELVDGDRDVAWRDFRAWQLASEKERSSWDEAPDE